MQIHVHEDFYLYNFIYDIYKIIFNEIYYLRGYYIFSIIYIIIILYGMWMSLQRDSANTTATDVAAKKLILRCVNVSWVLTHFLFRQTLVPFNNIESFVVIPLFLIVTLPSSPAFMVYVCIYLYTNYNSHIINQRNFDKLL